MSEELNATCDICGKKYHVCDSCKDMTSFTPWRVITDTMEHYKVFVAVSDYTRTGDKKQAKEDLSHCDLSDIETFRDEVKKVIEEILEEEKIEDKTKSTINSSSKKTVKKQVAKSVETDKEIVKNNE